MEDRKNYNFAYYGIRLCQVCWMLEGWLGMMSAVMWTLQIWILAGWFSSIEFILIAAEAHSSYILDINIKTCAFIVFFMVFRFLSNSSLSILSLEAYLSEEYADCPINPRNQPQYRKSHQKTLIPTENIHQYQNSA
jgi:hypothetical protein